MHEIEDWIETGAREQNINVRKLPPDEAMLVQREVTSRYVTQSTPCTWWWNFKRPIDEHYDRKNVRLESILPIQSGLCWLIPDTEAESLPVYEIDASNV